MPRLLRFFGGNWPLKLGAVALATVLYAGLVLAQNTREWPSSIPIEIVGQPQNAFLLDRGVPEVTGIRYRAPVEIAGTVRSSDFLARADLSRVDARGGVPARVPVTVDSIDRRIVVIDWRPKEIEVRLDPVATRQFAVTVDRGGVPAGLEAGTPAVEPATVSVTGASALVQRVSRVVARVPIDPSGINVNADYDVVALDHNGEEVTPVDIEPERVRIGIVVQQQVASASVPVAPRLEGTLPPGYRIRSVSVTPLAVTVEGEERAVKGLETIPTEVIDVNGRTLDFTTTSALVLPPDTRVLGQPEVMVRVLIVAETGSRTFVVGLALADARPDRSYTLSTPNVLVTLHGSVSELERTGPQQMRATLGVRSLSPGRHAVPVRVRGPAGLTVDSISPRTVFVVVRRAPAGEGRDPTPGSARPGS